MSYTRLFLALMLGVTLCGCKSKSLDRAPLPKTDAEASAADVVVNRTVRFSGKEGLAETKPRELETIVLPTKPMGTIHGCLVYEADILPGIGLNSNWYYACAEKHGGWDKMMKVRP